MNPLLRFTLAFAVGIVLHRLMPADWSFSNDWAFLAVCGMLLLLVGLHGFGVRNRWGIGGTTLLLFVGLGWIRTPPVISPPDFNHIAAYQAKVLSPPETRAKTYKVEVEILSIKHHNSWEAKTARVLLYLDKAAAKPHYGDVLLVRGAPRLVEPPLNPEQFDYQSFLALKGIRHQHYLRATDWVLTGQYQGTAFKKWAFAVGEWSDEALRRLIPYDREYAVAKAMVLGLRDDMDSELVQAYSAAGAVHVLSVSGFHITIFVGLLAWLLGFIKKRRKGKWLYAGLTLLTMWFYVVLTGLSAPAIRAALMGTLFLLAEPLGRKQHTQNALFGSALMLLAADPLLLFSVSFQLSYAALSGIIFLQPVLYQNLSLKDWLGDKLWAITTVAITAQVATYPICVYYFHQFPTYFLLANPFVMTLGFAMLPVAFITIAFSWLPLVSNGLCWILTGITWLLNQVVIWTEALPYSVIDGLSFSWMELLLVYGIIGCLLALLFQRDYRWLWSGGVLTGFLLVIQLAETQSYRNQKFLVVHAVSRQTALSLFSGQCAILVADSAFFQADKKPYKFYVRDFYTKRGIGHVTQEALEKPSKKLGVVKKLPFGKLIVWQNQRIALVDQPLDTPLPPIADYVVVRQTAFKKPEKLLQVFGSQQLIFDNSNKKYVLDSLQKYAQRTHANWYFVHQQGALVKYW